MILNHLPALTDEPRIIGYGTIPCPRCKKPLPVAVRAWVEYDDPEDPDTPVFYTDSEVTDVNAHYEIHELDDAMLLELDPADDPEPFDDDPEWPDEADPGE